jgi:hypothetical protein
VTLLKLHYAPVAQRIRALRFGRRGRGFKSLQAYSEFMDQESAPREEPAKFSPAVPIDEPFLIGEGEAWEGSLAQAVKNLHDGTARRDKEGNPILDTGRPPKVIFLAATSAIPLGFTLKECFRQAYSSEPLPKFYTVDVSRKRLWVDDAFVERGSEEILDLDIPHLQTLGEKYNAFEGDAVVFDHFRNKGETFDRTERLLTAAGYSDINYVFGWNTNNRFPEHTKPIVRKMLPPPARLAINITPQSKYRIDWMKEVGRRMAASIQQHT